MDQEIEGIYRARNMKKEIKKVSKCTACGKLDSIYHSGDVGYCKECGTPEHYEYIEEEDNE